MGRGIKTSINPIGNKQIQQNMATKNIHYFYRNKIDPKMDTRKASNIT